MVIHFSITTILFTSFLFILSALAILRKSKTTSSAPNGPNLPPGPKKLPIIGNLHLLFGKLPHHCLSDLSKIYGPILHLQLGQISTIVVSSPEIAKQVLQNHDSIFSERPYIYSAKSITYNFSDIAFARYGDHWRELRKICTLELLSKKRVESFRSIREEEYSSLVRFISSRSGSQINLAKMLYSSSFSIISQAALGRKSKHQESFNDRMMQIISLLAGFSPVDLFPSIRIFRLMNDMRPKLKKLHREVDEILESTIREHRANMGFSDQVPEVEDILSVLLRLQDKGDVKIPLTNTVIKAVILDLFLAGGEASATTVEWAMSEMFIEPRVMEKSQAEVRRVFASMGRIDESNLDQLKYLNCVIKETFRVHPPAPLLIPREAREKCMISGYEIPENSRLIVNAWEMGRDANHWKEPEKFYPERFLNKEVNIGGHGFELIPFGFGKRGCPGQLFGLLNIQLMLANLLYHFDWRLSDGIKNPKDLDMTEIFFTASRRKNNLILIPTPH